jgi:hypothetical protein
MVPQPKRTQLRTLIIIREKNRRHNEELHNLYSSSNLNGVNTSKRIKWAGT